MQYLDDKNKLFDLLAQGAIVVTPNNRLSASLLKQFFDYQAKATVDKPLCLPYNTMVDRFYKQLKFINPRQKHPELLTEFQCQFLWQNLIKADPTLTYSQGLLSAVMQAWKQCQQWQLSADHPAFCYTPQTQKFQSWWQRLDKQLKQQNLLCQHQIIPYLIAADCSSLWTTPIIWACFDECTPQQFSLQEYLTQKGLIQYHYDLYCEPAQTELLAAQDSKEEYQQLILWLQSKLRQGEQSIAVVVPDLGQVSHTLKRTLMRHLNPEQVDISLGQKLSDFTLVAHALTWLKLDTTLSPHQARLLLASPYLGQAKEEFLARTQYVQDSLLLNHSKLSLKTFIQDLAFPVPHLSKLLESIKAYPETASPLEWILLFQKRLNSLNFPGDYGLDSKNYQCFHRFTKLFDAFRQLSLLCTELSSAQAIEALIFLADNTIFQAQKVNAPIQVSGLLEASGCECDSLWILGLTDQCLPQKTHLSPFIPAPLQLELLMPHSTPDRELHFARQSLQRLQRGSRITTVFSYPRLQGDTPNLPCSLIRDLPPFPLNKLPLEAEKVSSLIRVEEAYQVPPKSGETLSGGTTLLANQAKCPFKAFAAHRLKAQPLTQASEGLDPRERGQLAHKVMELLWRALKSQEALIRLSLQDLNQLIDKAIHTALSSLNPDTLSHLVQEIEQIRLKRLVGLSLEWEKQRPSFSIAALEESYSINLAGLDFRVRVDRLDQVQDKKWIIDYKNTLPSSTPWNEDRPKEPQLLLYALLDEHINTLLFMQLKTGNFSCKGISEEHHKVNGINALKKESWEEQTQKWHQQLNLLAEEIQRGHCPPEPINHSQCQQCDFQNLCRFQME